MPAIQWTYDKRLDNWDGPLTCSLMTEDEWLARNAPTGKECHDARVRLLAIWDDTCARWKAVKATDD